MDTRVPGAERRYLPISDYALIGNRQTCALVGRNGSIDWCCVPALDSPSVFGAILDTRRGGHWRIAPAGEFEVERRYVGTSAVLETAFRTDGGRLVLTDFLPIRAGRGTEESRSGDSIVRMLRCTDGEVEVECEWAPRPDYARGDVRLHRTADGIAACSPSVDLWLAGVPERAHVEMEAGYVRILVRLRAGDALPLVCGWGDVDRACVVDEAQRLFDETVRWWADWASKCDFSARDPRRNELVLRSGMVLKILTNERTGAMAAAPTTSLPEEIGGVRNWDYRYCWVRDAGMTTRAFATLGHTDDGVRFLHFLEWAASQRGDPSRVQVMYGLQGELELPEFTLGHLDGHRDSRPVRIGNEAVHQRQLDVYGELIESAYELLRLEAELSPELWPWIRGVADHVCNAWQQKGNGIWEVRGPQRHFTHSKVKCWVALDRAIRIARSKGWDADLARWERECAAVHRAVLENGFSRQLNSFVQAFDCEVLDASSLLLPIVGFLPADDPRVLGTLDATLERLSDGGLVYRYLTSEAEDGVSGDEGAFVICSFWLSEALALAGRVDEAEEIFEGMIGRVNDVGLLPEQIDAATGEFLGNFPQAFSHIGLIDTAFVLDYLAEHGVEGIPDDYRGLLKIPVADRE